ncbi:hypothetical protein V7266_27515 [Neobacillus drentensis]|uniref:hypothetical protein n=1 Tax=Neobacillus drentensis TaxID=220684 RepID=UPI002FFDDB37
MKNLVNVSLLVLFVLVIIILGTKSGLIIVNPKVTWIILKWLGNALGVYLLYRLIDYLKSPSNPS